MFSRLLFVRLKAAEKALREGRLDEAYRLATASDLKDHRRAVEARANLVERLMERAREHFRADRFREALNDLDRAQACGSAAAETSIAELRQHVQTVATQQQLAEHSRRHRLEDARRRMEAGSLAAGHRILETAVGQDDEAAKLMRKLNHLAADADALIRQAERLIAEGQLSIAAERVRRAKAIDAHCEAVTRVEVNLCGLVFENVRSAIGSGRLKRAAEELNRLGELGEAQAAKRELNDWLTLADLAVRALERHDYVEARRQALSLQRLFPEVEWLVEAAERLRQMEEIHTTLLSGPLGEGSARDARRLDHPAATLDDTVAIPARTPSGESLPDRLLLLVDGGGSYLVLRGAACSIGRAASEVSADIPVLSDLAERHADLSRVEDDYFLFSDKEVEVSGQRTRRQLLRDNDRVVLGRKAKFTFRLPSRQSSTAVLDLSDTTKMPHDVRRVVLFHRHATIGNGPGAHIRCRHAGAPLVLFERGSSLWVRLKSDGHVDTEARPLRVGESVEIGGVSLVLSPWRIRSAGGMA